MNSMVEAALEVLGHRVRGDADVVTLWSHVVHASTVSMLDVTRRAWNRSSPGRSAGSSESAGVGDVFGDPRAGNVSYLTKQRHSG